MPINSILLIFNKLLLKNKKTIKIIDIFQQSIWQWKQSTDFYILYKLSIRPTCLILNRKYNNWVMEDLWIWFQMKVSRVRETKSGCHSWILFQHLMSLTKLEFSLKNKKYFSTNKYIPINYSNGVNLTNNNILVVWEITFEK